MRRWLAAGDMARRFGVVPRTINRWVHEGKLPKPITMGENGYHHFWAIDEIEAWEQKKLESRP